MLCFRCGAVVPFTGAFDFVVCPRCRTVIPISRAPLAAPSAVAAAPPGYTVPQAHEIERGIQAAPPPVHTVRRIARAAATAGAGVSAFLLLNNLMVLLLGAPIALRYAAATPDGVVHVFIVFPLPFEVASFGGAAAAVWHTLVVAAIAASFAALVLRHGRDAWAMLLRAMRGEGTPTLSEPNAFFVIARLWAASLFVVIAINLVAVSLGSAPNVPSSLENGELGDLLVSLAHASVWEEVVTRVLLLGLPLALLHVAARGRLEQAGPRYLFGGGFTLEAPAISLLCFQAVVFGVAHAPGWDLWKVPSATFFGLALGYLFLRYGLYACILLHFLNDYLSASIFLTETTAYPGLILLAFYFMLGVGIVCAIRYLFVLREFVGLGRVPEYLGGPAEAAPAVAAALPFAAAPEAPVRVEEQPAPPGGRG